MTITCGGYIKLLTELTASSLGTSIIDFFYLLEIIFLDIISISILRLSPLTLSEVVVSLLYLLWKL